MPAPPGQCEVVTELRQRLLAWEGAAVPRFSSGLGSLFPAGLRRGTLIEYLAESGCGALSLSLLTAREACREGGALLVIDREGRFYPPAAAPYGASRDVVLVRPRSRRDELWALHQALGCRGVGAVVSQPEKLDARAFRALQLAAERGGAVGLLIRPVHVRGDPTWSELQLLVESLPGECRQRRLRVEVVRSRSGQHAASVVVELDDETGMLQASHPVPVAPELATAAPAVCAPGA